MSNLQMMNKMDGVRYLQGGRAVLVNTAISQPRHQRRARMLQEYGMKVRVYAFGRGFYPANAYAKGIEVVHLGTLESRQYVRRLPQLVRAARTIAKLEVSESTRPALQYAFGLDSTIITSLAFKKSVPLVYEVGDIRNPDRNHSIFSRLVYAFEKTIVRRATTVVVTAPAFLEEYYSKMQPSVGDKGFVVENKLPADFAGLAARPGRASFHQPIRLGFVGAFRYADSLIPLVDAVSERLGTYELHLYGDGPLRDVLQARVRRAENLFYHGPFKNPDDLGRIYGAIDINYVVYDNKDPNVRMALPNKLYESIYFGKPIVVAANTQLAKRVDELGIGFVVDPRQKGFAESFLDALSFGELAERASNALALPVSHAVQNDKEVVSRLLRAVADEGAFSASLP